MSGVGASMANDPWPAAMNMVEPYLTTILWFEKAPELTVIADAFEKHLWPCHRFNSCIEGRQWVRRHEQMDRAYHFLEEELGDESSVEDFAMKTHLQGLPTDHPRWRVIRISTPPSVQSALLVHCHHSLGDGLGMLFAMSPLLGVPGGNPLATVPLPRVMLPEFARPPPGESPESPKTPLVRKSRCNPFSCLWGAFKGIGSFFRGFFLMGLVGHDTELSINEPLQKRSPFLPFSGKRQLTRFPIVPLSLIKKARENHGCTLNDIVMAAITGALRKYCLEVQKDEKLQSGEQVQFKSMVMLAMPRECSASDPSIALRNKMLFTSVSLPLSENSQTARVRKTVEGLNGLKNAAYMCGVRLFTDLVASIAPRSVLNKATGETWSKHTILVTKVPCTSVPLTFPAEDGQTLQGLSLVIANVMSQVSVISYNGSLYATFVADPDLIREAKKLGELWVSEIKELAGQA